MRALGDLQQVAWMGIAMDEANLLERMSAMLGDSSIAMHRELYVVG